MANEKPLIIGGGWKRDHAEYGPSINISIDKKVFEDGIDLSQYWISMRKNQSKKTPKSPDYTLVAKPKENVAPKPPPMPADTEEDPFF